VCFCVMLNQVLYCPSFFSLAAFPPFFLLFSLFCLSLPLSPLLCQLFSSVVLLIEVVVGLFIWYQWLFDTYPTGFQQNQNLMLNGGLICPLAGACAPGLKRAKNKNK